MRARRSLVAAALLLTAGAVVAWVLRARWPAPDQASARGAGRSSPGAAGGLTTEVAPDVFCLGPSGRSQTDIYFVREGSSWALVDAGWEGDAPRIRAAAQTLFGGDSRPVAILLTHAHPDHSGAAGALARAWGCPVLVHPAELPLAKGDLAAMERFAGPLDRWVVLPLMRALGRRRREAALASSSLADVVRPLEQGGGIAGLPGWEWVATPGHTPGHVGFFRASDRVVLTGDAVVTLAVNTWSGLLLSRPGLSGPPWYTTWDRRAARESVARIAALEPTVLGGGHGQPLTGSGTAEAIAVLAARELGQRSP